MIVSLETHFGMRTICRTCGDTGHRDALVLCSLCKIFAEHRYCLDKIPCKAGIEVWVCSECKSRLSTLKARQHTREKVNRVKEFKSKVNRVGNQVLKKGKDNRVIHNKRGGKIVHNLKTLANTIVGTNSRFDNSVSTMPCSLDNKGCSVDGNASYIAECGNNAPAPMEVENCSSPGRRFSAEWSRLKKFGMPSLSNCCTANVVKMPLLDVSNRSEFQVTHEGDQEEGTKCLKRRRRRLIFPEEEQCLGMVQISSTSLQFNLLGSTSNTQTDRKSHMDNVPAPMEVENCSSPGRRFSAEWSRLKKFGMPSLSNCCTANVVKMPLLDVSNRSEFQVTHEGDQEEGTKCLKRRRRRLILPEEEQYLGMVQTSSTSLQSNLPGSTSNTQTDRISHMDKQVSVQQKRKFATMERDQLNENSGLYSPNKVAKKKALDVKENVLKPDVNHTSTGLVNDSDQDFGVLQDISKRDPTCNSIVRNSGTQTTAFDASKNIQMTSMVCSAFDASKNIQMTSMVCSDHNMDSHSKPIIDCAWRGFFILCNKEYGPISAHISDKACERVWNVVKFLPPVLPMKKMLRSKGPKCFATLSPTEDNIALYFFAQDNRYPINHLGAVAMKDLMLEVIIGEVELLVFSSLILPKRSQTFQGKHYFWGVFKGRNLRDCNIESTSIASEITLKNWNTIQDEMIGNATSVNNIGHINKITRKEIDANSSFSFDMLSTPPIVKVKFNSVIQSHHQLTNQHNDLCSMTTTDKTSKLVEGHEEPFSNGRDEVLINCNTSKEMELDSEIQSSTNLGNEKSVAQKPLGLVEGHRDPFSSERDGEVLMNSKEVELHNVVHSSSNLGNDKIVAQKPMEVNSWISITTDNIEEDEFRLSKAEQTQIIDEKSARCIKFVELFEHDGLCSSSYDEEIYTLFPLQAEVLAMKMEIDESRPLDLELKLCSNCSRKIS